MKKLLWVLCLSLSVASVHQSAWSAVADEMTKAPIARLDFTDIMHAFYAGRTVQLDVKDAELRTYPRMGLTDVFDETYTPAKTLALMHPVITYQNHQGQPCHLAIIEKVAIEDGALLGGRVASAKADLYIFKKSAKGYELVSRTVKDDDFNGSWGRLHLDLQEIKNNIQPLGAHLTGSIIKNSHCGDGVCRLW